jgi:hypothetical protein
VGLAAADALGLGDKDDRLRDRLSMEVVLPMGISVGLENWRTARLDNRIPLLLNPR